MITKVLSLLILCLIGLWFPAINHTDDFDYQIESVPFITSSKCNQSFVTHPLDHITQPVNQPIGYYDSNGAGLAINDLDNDGDLDIVLANLAGNNAIFWNEGNFDFTKQILPSSSPTRAVSIVDVDGDSWLDIVFTQQVSAPLYWRNQSGNGFRTEILRGASFMGYAVNWADLDGDNDLDFVTGSYDVEISKLLGQNGPTSGIVYYENVGDRYVATRLANNSQALAILIGDINYDNVNDIIVGNDFALRDQYFSLINDEWVELEAHDVMPHSTMGLDMADINNNGEIEIYAVDMKPYSDDQDMKAQWRQVMAMMAAIPIEEDDPQIMENVLYAATSSGQSENLASQVGLERTGWSWSAKFGDLDNDGFQDLYVVNGMISVELFPYLPNDELVEENQAYRNLNGSQFETRPDWGLNSTSSGRGMSMGDLDNDGDLDIVVNNLQSNAVIFENQLCGGSSVEIDLMWNQSLNTKAIGSKVILYTSTGTYQRTINASSGYLSGDTSRAHIGFPLNTEIYNMQILWADGVQTDIKDMEVNAITTIIRK